MGTSVTFFGVRLEPADLLNECICDVVYGDVLTEVRGLKSGQEVELLREKVYAALEEYTRTTHPDEPGRFAKLLLRLPALRSIGLKCLEHLFFFRLIGDVPIDEFLTEMLESR
ncbi:hypothetical protein Cfor_03426, partial [Coptotermes formosanus]